MHNINLWQSDQILLAVALPLQHHLQDFQSLQHPTISPSVFPAQCLHCLLVVKDQHLVAVEPWSSDSFLLSDLAMVEVRPVNHLLEHAPGTSHFDLVL